MKERPIVMTPENAQKCHIGAKTQTRRLVKLPAWSTEVTEGNARSCVPFCPYGQVGYRLWVREAWVPCDECPYQIYRGQNVKNCPSCDASTSGLKWKPSIHMPRFACRTVLEITEVRVERVKDISPADALAEGVFCPEVGYAQHGERAPVLLYGFLWESIHGAGSWEKNPWVWVIAFKKVEAK